MQFAARSTDAPGQQTLPMTTEEPPTQVAQEGLASAQQAPQQPQHTITQLIRDFAKLEGCERYKGDSERIKLLQDYLWLRQLTPDLPFETFLASYTHVADFDMENLKHPVDAMKKLLPRTKKQADEAKVSQWSAKEVVDYTSLYVDMVREAENTGTPVPMTFNEFLGNTEMKKQFRDGAFKEPAAASQPKTRTSQPKEPAPVVRPTENGQRCVYTHHDGRQFRGIAETIHGEPGDEKRYVDFVADSGERFAGVGYQKFEFSEDPLPNPPATPEGQALPELARGKILIKKAQYPSVQQALMIKDQPMGNVAIGDVIYPFEVGFPEQGVVARINVVNGENGPYIDPHLVNPQDDQKALVELPPRDNIVGIYQFETEQGVFTVEVTANE